MVILSDATWGRHAPLWQARAAVGQGQYAGRMSVWLVPVTGVDGVTHEVVADDLRVAPECGIVPALCGARVVPAALIVEPGRRCAACSACPVDEPVAGASRRRRFGRSSWSRQLNFRRRCAASAGFGPQAVTA